MEHDTAISTTNPRHSLVSILEAALRAEAGVRGQQEAKRPTDYYAGRRAGFVCSAALVLTHLYGSDYDSAKRAVSAGVRKCGEQWSVNHILEHQNTLAATIADAALTE